MEEGGGDAGPSGCDGGESSGVKPSFEVMGAQRQRFKVELIPGETTIVSWKKLLKDAAKANGSTSAPQPPSNVHHALESRISPGQPPENEVKDAPPAGGRLSAVVEKIERLYVGKHSSDEEDLNDVPDDDDYDTEDSFIDDAELDEYFKVDNSAIKHDGFFVNRGKLERIEPTSSLNQQPKKRRRKYLEKNHVGNDDGHAPNKHLKVRKKAAGNTVPLVGKNSNSPSHCVAMTNVDSENVNYQDEINASEICSKQKSGNAKATLDSSPLRVSNGGATEMEMDTDKQKVRVLPSKNHGSKLKEGSESFNASTQRSNDKNSLAQCKAQHGRSTKILDELDQSVQWKEENDIRGRPGINVPEGKNSTQTVKLPLIQKKEGSSIRSKATMLEKAIRELEKMIAEYRPPAMEVLDTDISSQAVKRRLPPEIKQKLAKVARLAQASQGKISKELINRLMSIVGHLMQLRTLKRNLKVMVNMGLSAKQEKEDRFQQIKKEVIDMIKMRVPFMKSKAPEQQAGASDDFQEICTEEKQVLKGKCSMDDALGDKICDLYDLYVEGLDEDAGPQGRKLYGELAALWPSGFMDNHGIRRAICKAKDRRRTLYNRHKDQEKIKKKMLITKTEETAQVEVSTAQSQYIQEKLVTDSSSHGITSLDKPLSNTTAANTLMNGPSMDGVKQEKLKGSCNNSSESRVSDGLMRKKVKRKPELESGGAHVHPEKKTSLSADQKHKSQKQIAAPLQKTDLNLAPPPSPPSFEQLN